jgi:hypothetical protein
LKKSIFLIFIYASLSCSSYAASLAIIDPIDIGVGARALGMGKACVAYTNDTNSVFLNPAGLAYAKNWGLTSMYTSLISKITYTTIGAHYASSTQETFGFGFITSNLGGTIYTTYRDPTSGRILPDELVSSTYSSNVMLISYGFQLNKYLYYAPLTDYIDRTTVGLSFKGFYQSLDGTNETFTASGYDMDIGLIYKINQWLKAGFYGQNVLPSSMGAVLRWDTGAEESIPANFKLGLSSKILGNEAYWAYNQDLYGNLDIEGSFLRDRPYIYHWGLEWWPYNYLSLRFGVDQDVYAKVVGNGVDNNLSFGLGFLYSDFTFDYAYHQYGPLTENATHYFSLLYSFPGISIKKSEPTPVSTPTVEAKPKEEKQEKQYIQIVSPKDKTKLTVNTTNINAKILDPDVAKVEVNSIEATILSIVPGESVFNAKVSLPDVGKKNILIECYDKEGKTLKTYQMSLIKMAAFTDVPAGHWAHDGIINLATLNYINGYKDGTFKPASKMTRAELTALLVKATGLPTIDLKSDPFKDVKATNWAAKYIRVGVDRGLVTANRDGTFKPNKELTRVEGLMMIVRFAGLKNPDILREKPFADIPTKHWAAKTITAAKTEGILAYLKDNFEPNKPLTRADVAEMLSKTKFAKDKVQELFN